MFNWIKKLFTSSEAPKAEPLVLKNEVKEKAPAKAKKLTKAELSKMTKVKLEEIGREPYRLNRAKVPLMGHPYALP